MDAKNWEKKWWEISTDELENRMLQVGEQRTKPVAAAVKELYRSVDKVLKRLGADPDSTEMSLRDQCEMLGIKLQYNDDPRTPQLHGIFVFYYKHSLVALEPDILPYAWVSAPKMKKSGKAFCEIQYFQDNKMEESGEVKIV